MKKVIFSLILLTTFAQLGCREQSEEENTDLKIIIGANDLRYYVADDRISNAIGRVALGCTATHIGNGIVLTAGHCVKSSNCTSSAYNIRWGYTQNNRSGKLVSKCSQVLAHENNSLRDYAILRYSPAPSASLPINRSNRPKAGQRLTIFSHPNGIPLAWSGYCKHEGNYYGQRFSYKCDTMGGSSGAAVLNENFEIVGIHNLGSSSLQLNAGTYLADISAIANLSADSASCTGVNGVVYKDGTVTTYKGERFTCRNGQWEVDRKDVKAGSCIGVDGKTYDNGVVTTYRGNTYTCKDGKWI